MRTAGEPDVPELLEMVRELARYERLEEQVRMTAADLRRALGGPRPVAEALIAERAGRPVGFALFFTTFSTFVGRPGLWLEDLFVRETDRGAGVGRALLERLAALAVARGCGRLEWAALDWNESALGFYARLGAARLGDWVTLRLDGEALVALAAGPGRRR